IAFLDGADGRADDLAVTGDLDEALLADVVLVALDRDEVSIGEHDDVVRERRYGGVGDEPRRGGAGGYGAGHGGHRDPPVEEAPGTATRRLRLMGHEQSFAVGRERSALSSAGSRRGAL